MTTTDKAPDKVDTDLVTLTIDGVQVSVPKDTLVIRAAEQVGVQIPRFCDHPLLDPVGACRQCLVDIPDAGNGRGFPKPQASCTLPVAEGMVVNTQATSEVADKAQQGVMEFLLINHPLDRSVCDKGGECPLQNQAQSHGRPESRFVDVKRVFEKPLALSSEILLDRERCVLCQRCTRFSKEIAGDAVIAASLGQQEDFWNFREILPEAQKPEGASIKHDISVPVALIPTFIEEGAKAVESVSPGARPVCFGHMGDGNLHYNISRPEGGGDAAFLALYKPMNKAVHDVVRSLNGSISAEHGIGQLKRAELIATAPPVAVDLMRRVKAAFDPAGIMNPGKVI